MMSRIARDGACSALTLRSSDLRQLEREARVAYPGECCGLIEGILANLYVAGLHPTRNLSDRADAFAIDPAEQFRLMRALRGTGRAIIGCYHSHPGGSPQPSSRDLEAANLEGFVWLIAALRNDAFAFDAYVFASGRFEELRCCVDD